MSDKTNDIVKDIQKLGAQNEAAGKHWDKAVRYSRIISKLKGERDDARKELKAVLERIADYNFPDGYQYDDVMSWAQHYLDTGKDRELEPEDA